MQANTRDLEQAFLEKHLFSPMNHFLKRPSKKFRSRLVQLGYLAGIRQGGEASPDSILAAACESVERLHTGSLIIDDIQDFSLTRRGGPSYHAMHGEAVAISTGSFMFFQTLKTLESLPTKASIKSKIIQRYIETLEKAHHGQLLDVAINALNLPQEEVFPAANFVIECKTGALTGFALELGAILAGAEGNSLVRLRGFGEAFGQALQKFDDLGNAIGTKDHARVLTDLKLHRPSWVWAVVAKYSTPAQYKIFLDGVCALPETNILNEFLLQHHFIKDAFHSAKSSLDQSYKDLAEFCSFGNTVLEDLSNLNQQLEGSYQ